MGLGLQGVFQLIRESRTKYPELCVKSLRALLDLLQGQQPEGMKNEPVEVAGEGHLCFLNVCSNYPFTFHRAYLF